MRKYLVLVTIFFSQLTFANCPTPKTCIDFWTNYQNSSNQCVPPRMGTGETECNAYHDCIAKAVASNKREYCNDKKLVEIHLQKIEEAKKNETAWADVKQYLLSNLENLKTAKKYLISNPGKSITMMRVSRNCGDAISNTIHGPKDCTPLVSITLQSLDKTDDEVRWTIKKIEKMNLKLSNASQDVEDRENKLKEILEMLKQAGKVFDDMNIPL